ncbi:hypothetical protein AB0442_42105 [Kitasatospora sp. NPDC085895]|uniref:hypothetical protein n=1 Tax=Kitasatospora sp. NPDC085895 TaxID=3155057 RepID=UPI00344F47E4
MDRVDGRSAGARVALDVGGVQLDLLPVLGDRPDQPAQAGSVFELAAQTFKCLVGTNDLVRD